MEYRYLIVQWYRHHSYCRESVGPSGDILVESREFCLVAKVSRCANFERQITMCKGSIIDQERPFGKTGVNHHNLYAWGDKKLIMITRRGRRKRGTNHFMQSSTCAAGTGAHCWPLWSALQNIRCQVERKASLLSSWSNEAQDGPWETNSVCVKGERIDAARIRVEIVFERTLIIGGPVYFFRRGTPAVAWRVASSTNQLGSATAANRHRTHSDTTAGFENT